MDEENKIEVAETVVPETAPAAEKLAEKEETCCCCCEDHAAEENSEAPAAEKLAEKEETCCCCCEDHAAEENSEAPAAAERRERVHLPVTPEMLDQTSKALMTMLDFLGHDAEVKASSRADGQIDLAVESEEAGRIIGRKGQSLESLQLLLNRMMQKVNQDYPRIMISIDGYSSARPDSRGHGRSDRHGEDGARRDRGPRDERRPRREGHGGGRRGEGGENENIRQMALDAAKEVRRWGESVTLKPMNAHDRRIVHITLENEADIQTVSEGEGQNKPIVISLKK